MSEEVRALAVPAQAEKGLREFGERATLLGQRHRKKRGPGLGIPCLYMARGLNSSQTAALEAVHMRRLTLPGPPQG